MWDEFTPKRNITEFEEDVLRAVHHQFDALPQKDAAVKLGVSEAKISRTIKDIEEKAKTCRPIRIMLPILTKRQFMIYSMIAVEGMSVEAVSYKCGISTKGVRDTISRVRRKGMCIPAPVKHEQYMESMDSKVHDRF